MKHATIVLLVTSALSVMCFRAAAYELESHKKMSELAYDQSRTPGYLSSVFGISPTRKFTSGVASGRTVTPGGNRLPKDWIGLGSQREDDRQEFPRMWNHFHDPAHGGVGLTWYPVPFQHWSASDWALEDKGQTAGRFRQDFSLHDARDYFFEALTLREPVDREASFADTFYSLGHVIHLVQDMAQPQHVRDDWHLWGLFKVALGPTVAIQERAKLGSYETFSLKLIRPKYEFRLQPQGKG